MKDIKIESGIDDRLINLFKNNLRFTSKNKFLIKESEFPDLREIYNNYLKSSRFNGLMQKIKNKYEYEYVKLFFRHSIRFLDYYLK